MFRQPEMRDGEGAVQPGDAGESAPAIPPVDINTRAANRRVEAEGPDHARIFTVEVSVGEVVCSQGEGPNKQIAA